MLYLDVNVSDQVIAQVVAHIHLRNCSKLAELLVHFLEEVFKLRRRMTHKRKAMKQLTREDGEKAIRNHKKGHYVDEQT